MVKRIQLNIARLGAWYPEILVAPWRAEGAAQVDRIADEQAQRDRSTKLAWWYDLVHRDPAVGRRWVCRESPVAPSRVGQGPVHPQGRANAFREKWTTIMRPRTAAGAPVRGPSLEELEEWLTWIPQGGWEPDDGWDSIRLTGPGLQRRARASLGKGRKIPAWSATPQGASGGSHGGYPKR